MKSLVAVVLAAGQGKRMKSARPKVLHAVSGRPMVYYSCRAALEAGAERVVVVVSPGIRDEVTETLGRLLGDTRVALAVQEVPRGTGDAVRSAMHLVDGATMLILCGDTPLVRSQDLVPLIDRVTGEEGAHLTVLSCRLSEPRGYGRIIRSSSDAVVRIKEDRDLESDAERRIDEVNAGIYVARTDILRAALENLGCNNDQGEYYLTDVVESTAKRGRVEAIIGSPDTLVGVNDRAQLRAAERALYERIADDHARRGVTIHGLPFIDEGVEIEVDAEIHSGACLRGRTRVGSRAVVEVGCVLTDVDVAPGARLAPYSVLASTLG